MDGCGATAPLPRRAAQRLSLELRAQGPQAEALRREHQWRGKWLDLPLDLRVKNHGFRMVHDSSLQFARHGLMFFFEWSLAEPPNFNVHETSSTACVFSKVGAVSLWRRWSKTLEDDALHWRLWQFAAGAWTPTMAGQGSNQVAFFSPGVKPMAYGSPFLFFMKWLSRPQFLWNYMRLHVLSISILCCNQGIGISSKHAALS